MTVMLPLAKPANFTFRPTQFTFLPYHGTGYLDRAADLPTIMAPLTWLEPTMGLQG